jgi:O-antigen/teichoic acid export membrane protein
LVAQRHGRTALTSSLVSSVNSLSVNFPLLIFAAFYGATPTGLIAIALKIGSIMPLTLGRAASQSFWAEAAHLVKKDPLKLKALYRRTTLKLGLLSLPVGAACLLAPLYITYLLGGEKWAQVGNILMVLTPMIVSRITFAQLSHLIVHERQSWQLCWDVTRSTMIALILIYAGTQGWPLLKAVIALASVSTTMNFVLFLLNSAAIHRSIIQKSLKTNEH